MLPFRLDGLTGDDLEGLDEEDAEVFAVLRYHIPAIIPAPCRWSYLLVKTPSNTEYIPV
jgi:hypothetical protein